MLAHLRAADPTQPIASILFYKVCYTLTLIASTLFFRLRVFGLGNVPRTGPLLIVANHQSHLDPPMIGLALRRRHAAMIARSGLFKYPMLAWLINNLGAISLKENEPDTVAMKRAINALNNNRAVVIFPEGSRTHDGRLQSFQPGTWLLIRRAKCAVLPVAVEGAFDAWPRSRPLPSLARKRIAVNLGRPIPSESLAGLSPEQGLDLLKSRIAALQSQITPTLPRSSRLRAHPSNPASHASRSDSLISERVPACH